MVIINHNRWACQGVVLTGNRLSSPEKASERPTDRRAARVRRDALAPTWKRRYRGGLAGGASGVNTTGRVRCPARAVIVASRRKAARGAWHSGAGVAGTAGVSIASRSWHTPGRAGRRDGAPRGRTRDERPRGHRNPVPAAGARLGGHRPDGGLALPRGGPWDLSTKFTRHGVIAYVGLSACLSSARSCQKRSSKTSRHASEHTRLTTRPNRWETRTIVCAGIVFKHSLHFDDLPLWIYTKLADEPIRTQPLPRFGSKRPAVRIHRRRGGRNADERKRAFADACSRTCKFAISPQGRSRCTCSTLPASRATAADHPRGVGPEEIRAYQLHLTNEKQLTPATLVIVVSALRFLYRVTLHKTWSNRGRHSCTEETADVTGRAQPGRSGAATR